ncbi:MAG: class A beta-lactamase-related serine hydrolase [Gemmatimonadetes bacterium]|nr:class A beta-lactamase-related serine hydrolase [Gemmatimonadota bacterium]
MRRHTLVLAPALLSLALASTASAQYIIGARDDQAARVDSVFRAFDRTDSPGCALGVYQDGAIRYARGYGLASLEYSVPLSPRTVLDVGSISKQFTAMAMLILEKDGKLSLDDPIRKLYPEMPAYADRITWRRALSQTSGLRDLWSMWGQTGRTFAGDTVDALNVIFHSAEPNYEPGERYLYTNTGWILAAQAVYRLTGKTLAQFAEERIFTPLGMRDTRFLVDRAAIIPNLAESYSFREKSYRVQRNPYDGAIMGAGGIHTTVEDFGRWLNNYDAATVGGRDVVTTMTTATKLNDGSPATSAPGLAYAVGLTVGTARGLRVVSHGGSWGGFRGHFLRFPDQHFAVATFCNLTTSGPDSLAQKVAAIYLSDRMQPDTVGAWAEALAGAPRVGVPPAELRRLAGVWRNVERGEVRRTRMTGDTLVSVGQTPTPYVPLGGDRFRTEGGTEVRFEGEGPTPTRMVVRNAGGPVTFARADTVALDSLKLAEYAGDYRSDEVEVTHTWKVEKGKLAAYAGYRRLGVLEPSYQDGFTQGGSVIDVVRDRKGRITGFLVESGRVRHLRFTRVR